MELWMDPFFTKLDLGVQLADSTSWDFSAPTCMRGLLRLSLGLSPCLCLQIPSLTIASAPLEKQQLCVSIVGPEERPRAQTPSVALGTIPGHRRASRMCAHSRAQRCQLPSPRQNRCHPCAGSCACRSGSTVPADASRLPFPPSRRGRAPFPESPLPPLPCPSLSCSSGSGDNVSHSRSPSDSGNFCSPGPEALPQLGLHLLLNSVCALL